MGKKQIVRNILIAIIIGFVALSIRIFFGTSKDARDLNINKVDITKIADGTYKGEATISPVKVVLNTVVEKGKVVKVEILEHRNGIGGKAEGPIVKEVVEKQNLDVDIVSGATISSKAILKAIENSLKGN